MDEPRIVDIAGIECAVFGDETTNESQITSGSDSTSTSGASATSSSSSGASANPRDNKQQSNCIDCTFVLHGRLARKEKVYDYCRSLSKGLQQREKHDRDYGKIFRSPIVVAFDLPNHGTRKMNAASNTGWDLDVERSNDTHAIDMYSQMLATVKDLRTLIDFLPYKLNLKGKLSNSAYALQFSRVSVVGISQGGHTVLLALANEPRIDVGVALISSGDYLLNMQLRYEKMKQAFQADTNSSPNRNAKVLRPFEELYPECFASLVEAWDPIRNVHRLQQRLPPMLMINGAEDTLVPKECNVNFEAKLRKFYSGASFDERLQLKILPGVKHEVPQQMIDETILFLRNHLQYDSRL